MWLVLVNSSSRWARRTSSAWACRREWAGVENYATVFDGRQGAHRASATRSSWPSRRSSSCSCWVAWRRGCSPARGAGSASLSLLPVHHGRAHPAGHRRVRPGAPDAWGCRGRTRASCCSTPGAWMAFCVFLTTGFVKTIPVELEEAARLDGAGSLTIFRRIIFPLMLPINIAAGFILAAVRVERPAVRVLHALRARTTGRSSWACSTWSAATSSRSAGTSCSRTWSSSASPWRSRSCIAQRRIVGGLLGAGTDK